MGIRNIQFAAGEIYHIYNRGAEKMVIFKNQKDYTRFFEYLELAQYNISLNNYSRFGYKTLKEKIKEKVKIVELLAVTPIDNHYHLIIRQLEENGISTFMQRFGTAYSKYFNTKYNRTGTLCQGKFKARHVFTDGYLLYLYAYVVFNFLVHEKKVGNFVSCLDELFSSRSLYTRDIKDTFKTKSSFLKFSLPKIKEIIARRSSAELEDILMEIEE